MSNALIIGGTGFISRYVVDELRTAGYNVTIFTRGKRDNPFESDEAVDHFTGDRTSGAMLAQARDAINPAIVVDCMAYYPGEVRMATDVFSDVDAYVFVSSGAVYRNTDRIPYREDESPLERCTDEQAVDDSMESYGARKAECDRVVFQAAAEGVRALSVRPTVVYGPHDHTGRFEYWVRRVRDRAGDRLLVPGDGTYLGHLVAVQNVASAIRLVAEEGTPGEAYNVGDRSVLPLDELIGTIATARGSDVEVVTASERELEANGISAEAFPLYRSRPFIISTAKLSALGWDPMTPEEAIEIAVDGPLSGERTPGPRDSDVDQLVASLE